MPKSTRSGWPRFVGATSIELKESMPDKTAKERMAEISQRWAKLDEVAKEAWKDQPLDTGEEE